MQPRREIWQIRSIMCSVMVTVTLWGISLVHAATYYTATNGHDSNPGTEAQPFRTVNKGVKALAAGDTLYVKSGTYAESLVNPLPSGLSASQPTTITGPAAPNRPVLRPTSGNSYIILLNQNRANIRFKNLIIDGSAYAGTLNSAIATNNSYTITGLTIEDCEAIGKVGVGSTASGINIGTLTVATVRRCVIHGWDSQETNPGAHGLYWKGKKGLAEHNEIYGNNGYGLQFYNSANGVDSNIFRNNGSVLKVEMDRDGCHTGPRLDSAQ